MSKKEVLYTAICNLIPFLRKFSKKRWYRMGKAVWVIFDDNDGIFSNDHLVALGFEVEDYRRKL